MQHDIADELRTALRAHKPATFVFAHDEIVHDDHGTPFLNYVRTWSTQIVHHPSAHDHPHWTHPKGISEIVCVGTEEQVKGTEHHITQKLDQHAQVVSFPIRKNPELQRWGMVIRAKGPSKGTAVQWLANHYGISTQDVVVVGDWLNDLSMFEVAGRSFAMGQAPDVVRTAATDCLTASILTGGAIEEAAQKAGLL